MWRHAHFLVTEVRWRASIVRTSRTQIDQMRAVMIQRRERAAAHRTLVTAAGVALTLFATAAHAQAPRRVDRTMLRAHAACDAAAARYGYRIMRRDAENVNGGIYQLPLHVTHGTTEADVTCRYDVKRGVADVPRWDDRAGHVADINSGRETRRTNEMSREQYEVQRACENSINSRPGYRLQQAGTPVAHGARQWDVPLTVQRDGGVDQQVTCRYNTANGKVTLRQR